MEPILKIEFREDIKSNGFECLSLSELIAKPKDHDCFQPHRISFNWIFFVTEGSVNHMLDFKKYKLKKNDCLVISHNQIQAFDPNSEYKGYALLFTNEYIQSTLPHSSYFKVTNLFNYHLSRPKHPVKNEIITDVKHLFSEFRNCKYALKHEIIGLLFSIILLKLNSINPDNFNIHAKKGFQIFEQFRLLVEKDYRHSRNVNTYLNKINVSHKHLNQVCKRFTTKTSKEFIDYFIILEIKRKLGSTSFPIKNLCNECGFDEPTNFQKYFQKHTGMSPLKFRSGLQG